MTTNKYRSRYCIIRGLIQVMVVAFSCLAAIGCRNLLDNAELPSGVQDARAIKSYEGAIAMYSGMTREFANMYGGTNSGSAESSFLTIASGLLSDELIYVTSGSEAWGGWLGHLDARILSDESDTYISGDGLFPRVNKFRVNSAELRSIIRKYASHIPSEIISTLYVYEALSEIILAEMYCSGIPLSRIDFEDNYTLTHGFSLDEVYKHALILLDSGAGYSQDNAQLESFIRLLKARAYLGQGRINEANATVSEVPTSYRYNLSFNSTDRKFVPVATRRIGDNEGSNGLPYVSSLDPRTRLPALTNPISPMTIGTGIEARLIEAEAYLLEENPEWLLRLNSLRTSCTDAAICPVPSPAGEGDVSGLSLLSDPATGPLLNQTSTDLRSRLNLVFRERAYWLFLTARRQGDLRRLVRNYGYDQSEVYPVGEYRAAAYGSAINIPVPIEEQITNRLYTGCNNRYE